MKRYIDVYKKILLALEADESDPLVWVELDFEDYAPDVISYHIMLLSEDGYLQATDCSSQDGSDWKARCLTAPGHDFLDCIRDESIWATIKQEAKKVDGSLTPKVIADLATYFIKQELGLTHAA